MRNMNFAEASHEYDCLRQPSNSSHSVGEGQVGSQLPKGLKPQLTTHDTLNTESNNQASAAYGDTSLTLPLDQPIVKLASKAA